MSDYTPEQLEAMAEALPPGLGDTSKALRQAARDARALQPREARITPGLLLTFDQAIAEVERLDMLLTEAFNRAERAEAALAGIRAWLEGEKQAALRTLVDETSVHETRRAVTLAHAADAALAELDRLTTGVQ